jgi:deoxycytidylate deaminase
MNEHKAFLKMAVSAAGYSPDLSTRNGAVLHTRAGAILRACNEAPPQIPLINGRCEAPLKYDYIEHAERRVIYQAAAEGFETLSRVCQSDHLLRHPRGCRPAGT